MDTEIVSMLGVETEKEESETRKGNNYESLLLHFAG
jgi:hypothetical protein